MKRTTLDTKLGRIRRSLKQRREDGYVISRVRKHVKHRRMDKKEPDSWITVKGNHIPVDENKKPIGGQLKALGEGSEKETGSSSSKATKGASSAKKYVSSSVSSKAKVIGGYKREHTFKNGYGVTHVDPKDKASDSGETMRMHTNDNGEWTEEREALHSKIIDNTFRGVKKANGKPVTTFMGGGPASGKSYVVENEAENLNMPGKDERILVDPDACKKPMPEYDPDHPSPVHEESSALAKRITKIAQENGYNVLVDGTGDGSVEKMRKKIKEAKEAGHTVNGVYVFKPIEDAIIANAARERSVKDGLLIHTHKEISKILPEIAKDFDDVKLYANMKKGEPPVLIASGGGGKGLTIHNQELYQMFLDNANYKYDPKRIEELKSLPEAQKKKKGEKAS